MACFQPVLAVDLGINPDTGKHKIKFLPRRADLNFESARSRYGSSLFMLPCGHCVACAQDYARTWQLRIMCEAQYYDKSCFITLTYAKNAPLKPSKDDLRRFIKAVRNKYGKNIKFFASGELGEISHRSHYHLIFFGVDFLDGASIISRRGFNLLYRSPDLDKLWKYGFASVGCLDVASAGYVSKYCDKKKINSVDSGEFVIMSRGLGRRYFLDHKKEIFESDYLYFSGNRFKIPRYFLLLALNDSDMFINFCADDYLSRKRSRAIDFRYGSTKSFSVEELALLDDKFIAEEKYKSKEVLRDVY